MAADRNLGNSNKLFYNYWINILSIFANLVQFISVSWKQEETFLARCSCLNQCLEVRTYWLDDDYEDDDDDDDATKIR